MKKEVIGHTDCPVCGCDHADIKEDKNGHSFIFCPDCAAQCFTRNEFRDSKLRARMRPVTVTVTVPPVQKQPEPTKQPVPPVPPVTVKPAPTHKPAQKNAPPVDPAPLPPKKKAGWFTPLIGGDA